MPSEPTRLEIVDQGGGSAVTRLSGDLDIMTSVEVKRDLALLVDAGHVALQLDLSEVGFVDSSGLGALVAIHRHAEAHALDHDRAVPHRPQPFAGSKLELTAVKALLSRRRSAWQ